VSASAYAEAPARPAAATRRRGIDGTLLIFALVAGAQLAFGLWMSARGFRWGDAFYRSTSALFTLHSTDPKLADIGFVWMPLPTILSLPWAALYPLWQDVVSSGAAASLTSAVCGGASAAILLFTARRLGLPSRLGWAFALVVSTSPMVFLYAGTGMAEGVGAPFLIAATCFLTLFWHSGRRWWIAAAGVALGLAVASLYEAVPYGAALFVALAAGILWSSEARPSAPQGRARAVEGLGMLLVIPAIFVGLLWIAANAVIMGDPLFFMTGAYGYSSYRAEEFTGDVPGTKGDLLAVAGMLGPRVWPFLIPLAALLLVRLADRRLWRIETASLLVIGLSTIALVAPMAYSGTRMEFLRYHMYPLYAAAGWGLYEIATSRQRRRAIALVFAGWLVAIPASLAVMANPGLGTQEYPELKALVQGRDARELGYGDPVITRTQLASYLDATVLARNQRVLLDSYQGAAIAAQVQRDHAGLLVMTFDSRFRAALADPDKHRISYVLLPDPESWPQDVLNRTRPRLWTGREPGFRLVKAFHPGGEFNPGASQLPERWRLYAVGSGAPVLPTPRTGAG
jgi:dolichyl-phosphate-mannose-protein mannosyltransferase